MSTNVLSLRTRPFGRPSGGGLRNHKISTKNSLGNIYFLYYHIKAHVSGQIEQGHISITLLLSLRGGFELYDSVRQSVVVNGGGRLSNTAVCGLTSKQTSK